MIFNLHFKARSKLEKMPAWGEASAADRMAKSDEDKEVLGTLLRTSIVSHSSKQEVSCQGFERKNLCNSQKAAFFALLRGLVFDSLENYLCLFVFSKSGNVFT